MTRHDFVAQKCAALHTDLAFILVSDTQMEIFTLAAVLRPFENTRARSIDGGRCWLLFLESTVSRRLAYVVVA